MTEELQRATALLDEIVDGWANPKTVNGYPSAFELRPEDLMRVAILCGSLRGEVLGDSRLQFEIGKTARKIYNVENATGKFRSVLARLATILDELRSPELVALQSDTSPAAEARKYELRQNNLYGFETETEFEGRKLRIETANGAPFDGRLQAFGCIIETQ